MATRSYFASDTKTFLDTPNETILGALAIRVGVEHAGNENQQIRAWSIQIELLKNALEPQGEDAHTWGVLIELPLLRLARRIDTVLLIKGVIVPIEFKIGANRHSLADIDQAVDYALCLRDFHSASRGHLIIPILLADQANSKKSDFSIVENVGNCLKLNGTMLTKILGLIANISRHRQIDWQEFDSATYNPTPNIVTAAKSIYAGHTVNDIGRADASADGLEVTAQRLREISVASRAKGRRSICFVTGEPGSGKTLLGLELVFSGDAERVAGEPAALLSGNRPLVKVLQEAIAQDAKVRLGMKVGEARRQTQQALQTLLGYLKDHNNENSLPPEHVVVFDEAQRAWDAETGLKLLGRRKSEPELFLEILGRVSVLSRLQHWRLLHPLRRVLSAGVILPPGLGLRRDNIQPEARNVLERYQRWGSEICDDC